MSDLKAKLLDWLRTTGFPLELRVGRRLQANNWGVNNSRWYPDADSGKLRELDIHAMVGAAIKGETYASFCLCIECKTSKDHPWVALGTGRRMSALTLRHLACAALTGAILGAAKSEGIEFPTLIGPSAPVVGGVVSALGKRDESGPSSPYSAMLQARGAAFALDRSHSRLAIENWDFMSNVAAFLPLVVLDGALFHYELADDLKENLEEVDAADVSPHSVPCGAAMWT